MKSIKNTQCFGCRLAHALEPVYVVYEDEKVICILDIDPFNEGHILLLPKEHFVAFEDLDASSLTAVMNAVKKIRNC